MHNIDPKSLALESPIGRSAFAASQLIRASLTSDPYLRAAAYLRAWRSSGQPHVVRTVRRYLASQLAPGGIPRPLVANPLLQAYIQSPRARALREAVTTEPGDHVRMREPRQPADERRQGDLIVLKVPDDARNEKGVLLIKYSESIERFVALFDVASVVQRYMLVLEPSWWGYQDATLFLYAGSDADVVIQAPAEADYRFLSKHGFGMRPVRTGAGDWVDPQLFSPGPGEREFDVVMVSSWNRFKRHDDLFDALNRIRVREGRALRTALIGYPNGLSTRFIRGRLERYGIEDQCVVYDSIPPRQVADIVGRSRLYVLLSKREGANKAMYEAMFCDTPVLAPVDHRGINRDHINPETGLTFDRDRLADALLDGVTRWETFSPRAWALRNTGYANATRALADVLAQLATSRGQHWARPLVAKKNQPNLRYASEADRTNLAPEFDRLRQYLR